jgi:hypothetical protein
MGKQTAIMESTQKNREEQYIIFFFTVPVKVNSKVKVNTKKSTSTVKVNVDVAMLTVQLGLTWQKEKIARSVARVGGAAKSSSGV